MKSPIKKGIMILEKDDNVGDQQHEYLNNVDITTIIDYLIKYKQNFNVDHDILITRTQICDILIDFKDKNTICCHDVMETEDILQYKCKDVEYFDEGYDEKGDGILRLMIVEMKDKSVCVATIEFLASDSAYRIFHGVYYMKKFEPD
jgi:hypothetical protein